MIHRNIPYDFNFSNLFLTIRDNCHDFGIDPLVADLSLHIPVLAELLGGYSHEFNTEETPNFFLRVSLEEGAEHPFSMCAGDPDKMFAVTVDLNAAEIASLYQSHLTIPELSDEVKSEILELPDWVQATADDAEKVRKMAGMMLTLARREARNANPDFVNVPGWGALEYGVASEILPEWEKLINTNTL